MRMNRGTILLLVVSLVVIIAVLVLTINQAAAPGETPETLDAAATPEALFPGMSEDSIARLEVRDDLTGDRTVLLRSSEGEWSLEPADPSGAVVDPAQMSGLATSLFGLEGQESFEADELAQYGLDQPLYSVYAVATDGAIHVMHVGNQNPAGSRYYVVTEQIAPGTTRPDLELLQPLLERAEVDTSLTEDDSPLADQGIPTLSAQFAADPTLAALAENMQEEDDEEARNEMAATYAAIINATNEAGGMGTTGNVPGGVAVGAESTASATEAAGDAEATDSAEATEMVPDLQRAEVETSLETLEADVIDEAAATPGPDITAEATVEETAEPVQEPLVALEGPQTIYLVNAQPIRTLIAIITTPPLALPTAQPTVEEIIPLDLTQEAGTMDEVLPSGDATSEATEMVEVTAAP